MSTTVTIPHTALAANQVVTAGPAAVTAGQFVQYEFILTRNESPGTAIDTLTGAVFTLEVDQSTDGGTTWPIADSNTVNGGVVENKGGTAEVTTNDLKSSISGAATALRARATAAQAFATSGSLTLS